MDIFKSALLLKKGILVCLKHTNNKYSNSEKYNHKTFLQLETTTPSPRSFNTDTESIQC